MKRKRGSPVKGRKAAAALLTAVLAFSGCTTRRTVRESFVFHPVTTGEKCRMTWQAGDYWEFIAWAVMDDPEAAPILAMSAGYPADSLPPPGTRVSLPLDSDMEEALENRLEAARIVREATALHSEGRDGVIDLLNSAVTKDPHWTVPRTNMALLFLEQGDKESARSILEPVAMKYAPALMLSMLDWEEGLTATALRHIDEAMMNPDPPPEALAAAGVIYTVTGEHYLASLAWRKILENPDAPPHIRIRALEVLLRE